MATESGVIQSDVSPSNYKLHGANEGHDYNSVASVKTKDRNHTTHPKTKTILKYHFQIFLLFLTLRYLMVTYIDF